MTLAKKLNKLFLKVIDWFLVEPKRLVRLVVLSICSIIVFFQLWECAMKLLHPPISTHSHFDLNHTMHYPAVTFCREPAFKINVLEVRERKLIQVVFTKAFVGLQLDLFSINDVELGKF